jgi:ubiquinone/menaquinone biosynthesis C-methylase UbiE
MRMSRALDFGCGAGRLTQALATRFDRVDGVDVATSMVDLARRHNTHPDRVAFHLNERPDLRALEDGSYDFILSIVVFQHMSNDLKAGYLREFVRVLAPGGVAVVRSKAQPESLVRSASKMGLIRTFSAATRLGRNH